MRRIKFISFIMLLYLFSSCNDTVVVSEAAIVTPGNPPISGYFVKNVLIEDYTGTWCGNCARVSYAVSKTEELSDKIVAMAIHNGNDPYNFVGIQPLQNLISPGTALELPQSRLNRVTTWTFPETSNLQQAINLTDNNCTLGLAMNSTVNSGTINLNVKLKLIHNYSNLKLGVYVLENGLIHSQANYTSYFGGINPVTNFVHNHVLRASLTNLLGNEISENTNAGQTITKNFTVAMPTNISNVNNISFVAVVFDANNNALNSRAAVANENQSFQENP